MKIDQDVINGLAMAYAQNEAAEIERRLTEFIEQHPGAPVEDIELHYRHGHPVAIELSEKYRLREALREALALVGAWRQATSDTLGRTTAEGSHHLDYMIEEEERLTGLLDEGPVEPLGGATPGIELEEPTVRGEVI